MLEQTKITRHRFFYPIVILLVWTAFGLFFGTQNYLRDVYLGKTPSLAGYLISWILCGYSWAILTVPVLWFARRYAFGGLGWFRFFGIHIPAGAIFALTQLGIYVAIASILFNDGSHSVIDYYKFLLASEFQSSFLVYFAIIATVYVYDHFFDPRRLSTDAWIKKRGVVNLQTDEAAERIYPPSSASSESNGHRDVLRRISVKENGRIVLLDVNEINWITSDGNYINLHTPKKKYILRETMNSMEKKLDSHDFVRLRRSTIVRIKEIKEFHPTFNGEYDVVLKNGTKLSASRRYRKNLESILKA